MPLSAFDTAEAVDRLVNEFDFAEKQARGVVKLLNESFAADIATKRDLASLATKEELALLATKEQVATLATREELATLATKEELATLATKEELATLATREELAMLRKDVENLLENLDVRLNARIDMLAKDLTIRLGGLITVGLTAAVAVLVLLDRTVG